MIFDTNVLIYLSKYTLSPEKLLTERASISIISKIEALGFDFTNKLEHNLLKAICGELDVISLSDSIAEATISLREQTIALNSLMLLSMPPHWLITYL